MAPPSDHYLKGRISENIPDQYHVEAESALEGSFSIDFEVNASNGDWTLLIECTENVESRKEEETLGQLVERIAEQADNKTYFAALVSSEAYHLYRYVHTDETTGSGELTTGAENVLELLAEEMSDIEETPRRVVDQILEYQAPQDGSDNEELEELMQEYREQLAVLLPAKPLEEDGIDDSMAEEHSTVLSYFQIKSATIIIGRITFGQVLGTLPKYGHDTTPSSDATPHDLQTTFKHIRSEVLFKQAPQEDPYTELLTDLTSKAQACINDFIEELEALGLWKIPATDLETAFRRLTPTFQREALGNYHTRTQTAEAMATYTIHSSTDRILDPACGAGDLLSEAANELDSLHRPFESIYGIDIDDFAAEIAAIRLFVTNIERAPEANATNIFISDIKNKRPEIVAEDRPVNPNSEQTDDMLPPVDALLAHLPNTGSENYDWRDWQKLVTEHCSIDTKATSGRWNLAAYYLVYATQFLAEDGCAAFLLPSGWLSRVSYQGFRRHLTNNYTIDAVIELTESTATSPQTLIFLTNTPPDEDTETTFASINSLDNLLELTQTLVRGPEDLSADNATQRPQSTLNPDEPWRQYLTAPAEYHEWKNTLKFELGDFFEFTHGIQTGANEFFLDPDPDLVAARHTIRVLAGKHEVTAPRTSNQETSKLLTLDPDLREALTEITPSDPIQWLQDNDEPELAEYVEQGMEEGYHERQSMKYRDIWFKLGEPSIEDFYIPRIFGSNMPVLMNDGNIGATSRYYVLGWNDSVRSMQEDSQGERIDRETLQRAVAAYLNSTPFKLALQLTGSKLSGGYTETTMHQLKRLPFPNFPEASDSQIQELSDAFQNFQVDDHRTSRELNERLCDVFNWNIDLDLFEDHLETPESGR